VRDDVSAFLTSPWIWTALSPSTHVLLFQADSIICANANVTIDDFTQYDFAGAPISTKLGKGDEGVNGGLSLRKRELMESIVRRWSWKEEKDNAPDPKVPNVAYEDQWFWKKCNELNLESARAWAADHGKKKEKGKGKHGKGKVNAGIEMGWSEEGKEEWEIVKLPTPEEAMKFAVETIWYERPLGYHQVASWQWDRVKEIDEWCPEHRIAGSEKMRDAGE
jgi:hypothetical protein